jgi:hypothetical protein
VWRLEADSRDQQLIPYSELESDASQPVVQKANTAAEQDQLDW